jgi:hypothetical protein
MKPVQGAGRAAAAVLFCLGTIAAAAAESPMGRVVTGQPFADIVPVISPPPRSLCEFCNLEVPPLVPERFRSEMAGQIGSRLSDWNLALIARTDSLLHAEFFGPPDNPDAVREAARYFKYHALTAMDFIGYLSTQEQVAWISDEREIGAFYRGFANPGIYPVWGLRQVVLGGGAFCMEFDVARRLDAQRMLGTRPVRLRTTEVKIDGDKHRAWSMEMPTSCSGTANFLFCDRYAGRIRQLMIEDGGQALKVIVLEELDGFYVRKWGTHKCEGLVLWRTSLEDDEWPPADPCIGGAAYFPGLRLKLPGPIPDVNLDDLRSFPGFQPLIAAAAYESEAFPAWLPLGEDGLFRNWQSEGEIPAPVRAWFPDR